MKKVIAIIICQLFLGLNFVLAHNMWIETLPKGAKGSKHTAKVFLGGYGENERDSISKWFNNTSKFVLWLTSPDGTKKQLLSVAAGNCYEAIFTPDKEGVYTLSLALELSEVYDNTRYKYYAIAQVMVGTATTGEQNLETSVDLFSKFVTSPKVGYGPATVLVKYKGNVISQAKVSVGSPELWVKSIETNKDGTFSFEPLWPGVYVLEVFYNEKESGTVGQKNYTSTNNISTYSISISK